MDKETIEIVGLGRDVLDLVEAVTYQNELILNMNNMILITILNPSIVMKSEKSEQSEQS